MAYDNNEVWKHHFGEAQQAKDKCGAEIHKGSYGDTSSSYGWEVDHILPLAHGGTDRLDNLRPLHVSNNRAKGESLEGDWDCEKTW